MLAAFWVVSFCLPEAQVSRCEESFLFDSIVYTVPQRWCGQANDSNRIANPESLVRLPDEFSWQEFRIYLAKPARDAFVEMANAAMIDSVSLIVQSGFRSARYQRAIIRRRLQKEPDMNSVLRFVAPPGYSEHETGMAVDLKSIDGPFEKSQAYRWLQQHAVDFGFIESIPEDSTGFAPWEPWHWLYSPDAD